MSNNNNKEIKGEVRKRCPFNSEWCGDWCPRFVTVFRTYMGQRQTSGMCVDVANNLMLSEINQKTMAPEQKQPKIQLPGGIQFGRG